MKVVHAIRSEGFAGVEVHVLRLALTQRERGMDVGVIGGAPSHMAARLAVAGIEFRPARSMLDVTKGMVRIDAPDVVHAHMTAAEVAVSMSRRDVPIVATRHFAQHRGGTAARRALARAATRALTAQIAVSKHVAAHIEGTAQVIYSGVPNRPTCPTEAREPVVLLVQRLEPEKQTSVALRAFAESGLADAGWRLRIAGDGALRDSLSEAAGRLGIAEATEFLGHRTDVPDLMEQASVLIAPVANEALGITVLEAMSAGLPVIAAASGGHLETVGLAQDAALFAPGDAAGASRLLRTLADDPTRRQSYGAALRDIQRETFTLEAQAEATDAVYRSVL